MKFTESQLEDAIIQLLGQQRFPHVDGRSLERDSSEVLIKDDLRRFLDIRYADQWITESEIEGVILKLEAYSSADLYRSNKAIMKLVSDGFLLKREDHTQKDIYVELIDYSTLSQHRLPKEGEVDVLEMREVPAVQGKDNGGDNIFKIVNQLEIEGSEKRIPDGILYINGIPLVVFEFKSAIREEATIYSAYEQVAVRYARDIPELLKYNAFTVISDGVNNKIGSLFAKYEFFYPWRKVTGDEEIEKDGIDSLHTMLNGLFQKKRLIDVIRNFIYVPDVSRAEAKIVCRYPQYYAARKLFENIRVHRKRPDGKGGFTGGDGKGGTYFGATGCGKSYTMLFLTRLLMRSVEFSSPTIILITDRTDLDSQLADTFVNAKSYIGDADIESVQSRSDLRDKLKGRQSGGVFLTTIHKFNEDAELLTDRTNVICISDEAHRSQVNLDQKIKVDQVSQEVKKSYGFAYHLHNSLPNATYVGFTGTPIDATYDVFGQIVDSYTMAESVKDEITVRIVYEGRAAKVLADNTKLKEIEKYYADCQASGASDYAIEQSKKAMTKMKSILGDPDRLAALAKDFIEHYETRVAEGSTVAGKAMFVSSSREVAYEFYKQVILLLGERSSRCVTLHDFMDGAGASSLPESLTTSFGNATEWHTRNLPHRDRKGIVQSITFRLADSMPKVVLEKIESEIGTVPEDKRALERRKKQQWYLDQGAGCCALKNPEVAECVMNALRHHDGEKYDLLAWSIMPNHVHVLIHTKEDVSKVIQSWKSYTGKWALKHNRCLKLGIPSMQKAFWQPEYWDRFIRNEEHFNNAVKYILENPKTAGFKDDSTAQLYTGHAANDRTKQELHPSQIKMVMTRGKDDLKVLYDMLGTSDYRKILDGQFKDAKSSFKIAIVVDMWLTGFDVPFLDTIYIDKPLQKHSLIQTISRVNRKFSNKQKGLVVDYFGIKSAMNQALAKYSKTDATNFEDVQQSIIVVRDYLDLLARLFSKFDSSQYFTGDSLAQLQCLNEGSEYVQLTEKIEHRFMQLVKRLKAGYDICCGADEITDTERNHIHFYLAIRSIVVKLTRGNAPDTAQMNTRVRDMIAEAIKSDGIEEIFTLGDETATEIDIFDDDYLNKLSKIKLPNTKAKLLQKMLQKAISELKKINKMKGVDFTKKLNQLVEQYNERSEDDVLVSNVLEDFTDEIIDLYKKVKGEYSPEELPDGIDFEEKAFYDILKALAVKYDFTYPEDKLIELAKIVKDIVADVTQYPDWDKKASIKATLKAHLIVALAKNGYPPVDRDEVYKEIFEQAENYKKYNS